MHLSCWGVGGKTMPLSLPIWPERGGLSNKTGFWVTTITLSLLAALRSPAPAGSLFIGFRAPNTYTGILVWNMTAIQVYMVNFLQWTRAPGHLLLLLLLGAPAMVPTARDIRDVQGEIEKRHALRDNALPSPETEHPTDLFLPQMDDGGKEGVGSRGRTSRSPNPLYIVSLEFIFFFF